MPFYILDSYNDNRYLYILSVSPSERKSSNLYIYQLPIASSQFKYRIKKSYIKPISLIRSKKRFTKPLLSRDHFGTVKSRLRYGYKYYHCISFPCKVIRSQWGPLQPSNLYSTLHQSFIISSGSFMVLTADGILRLFIISDGKPYLSLSMDVSEHIITSQLRWIFISSQQMEKNKIKKTDYKDLLLWSSTSNSIIIYRIYGIYSPNNHVWAHCILPYEAISLQMSDFEIVKACYNYTAYKFCACRVVDIDLNSECSANRLVPLTLESDQSHFNSASSSRILPPVMLTVSKGSNLKNLLIYPNLVFKSNSTTSVSLYNQLRQISYSVYKISPIIDNFNANFFASKLILKGYVKSALLLSHKKYFGILVLLYPACIKVYVFEPLNPFQTLKLSCEQQISESNDVVDLSVLTMNTVSLIAVLLADNNTNEITSLHVSIFLLLEDLSLTYLHTIEVPSTILPLSHFVLWYAGLNKAILQVGSIIFTLQLDNEQTSWSLQVTSHEYTFPNIATISALPSLPCCGCGSGCENFACALIKFGQFSLLQDFLTLSHSDKYQLSLDILDLIDGNKPANREGDKSKLSGYFKDVPWNDFDFEDIDLNMFLGRNGVYWNKSRFASAQFKLLSSVIGNCAVGAHPFLIIPEFDSNSAYNETSSLTYWAIKYDQDVELVKYIISKFSGKDDIFILLSKLQVGMWIKSKEAFNTLSDWIIKELVIVFRKNPKEEDYFDQLSLWCVLSNKLRLLSSLAKIAGNEKLCNFLLNDFALDEWKSAAEKNAFAAISKQRYYLSVSFFLLADKYEDALSISKQRIPIKTVSLLLMKFAAPTPFVVNEQVVESRTRCPFNKITESDDMTLQQLINFSSTFGPHALYFVASYFEIDYFKPILKGILNKNYCFQIDPSEAYIDKCTDLSVSTTIVVLAFSLWPTSANCLKESLRRAHNTLTSENANEAELRLLLLLISLALWATNVPENQDFAIKIAADLTRGNILNAPHMAILANIKVSEPERLGKFLGCSMPSQKMVEYLSDVFHVIQGLRNLEHGEDSKEIALLDLLKRIQWEICDLVNKIEKNLMVTKTVFDFANVDQNEHSQILIVPSGPLAFATYLPEVNELFSFNKTSPAGILFRDWVCSLDSNENSINCSTSCLFTICSLLKKFKGKNVSSLSQISSSPGKYVAGAVSGTISTTVIESSSSDSTKPGLYKVNVNNTDCFSVLHTLSEKQICAKLSPNMDRLAIIDSYGWVSIFKVPNPKSGTLCGIHCYTFRAGDQGKSLAWVHRGNNMGSILVTITGVHNVKDSHAMSLDNVGAEANIGCKAPLGQQLSIWLLYTGKNSPRLGLSCGLDAVNVKLTSVESIIVNEEPYILLGDSEGNLKMIHIHNDTFRLVYHLQCLQEPIVEIIDINKDSLVTVIGEKGNAALIKCTNIQLDIQGSAWKIISLVDGHTINRIKSAKMISYRLIVLLAKTKGDKYLLHHTHLPLYVKLRQ